MKPLLLKRSRRDDACKPSGLHGAKLKAVLETGGKKPTEGDCCPGWAASTISTTPSIRIMAVGKGMSEIGEARNRNPECSNMSSIEDTAHLTIQS